MRAPDRRLSAGLLAALLSGLAGRGFAAGKKTASVPEGVAKPPVTGPASSAVDLDPAGRGVSPTGPMLDSQALAPLKAFENAATPPLLPTPALVRESKGPDHAIALPQSKEGPVSPISGPTEGTQPRTEPSGDSQEAGQPVGAMRRRGIERFDGGLSRSNAAVDLMFELEDLGELRPEELLELYRLEKARGEESAGVGTVEEYLRRLVGAAKERGLPLAFVAEQLLEFEANRRVAGGHGRPPSLLAVAQAFEKASLGLGRPAPGLGAELESMVAYAWQMGLEDPQAYERLDPSTLLAGFVEEALGRVQEGRSWPELRPFLDQRLVTPGSPERKIAALRRALRQALDSDALLRRRLAQMIARHFRLGAVEQAQALGRLRQALETVELRFAEPGDDEKIEGAQAMHVTELDEAGSPLRRYILFNPIHRALPARLLAGTFLHELFHELGFGEYAAHRGQNLYFRRQRRAAGGKGRAPESRYEEDQAALDRDIRGGELVETLLGRYAPANLSAADDDRRAVRKYYLRRALRVQEAARTILSGLEAGRWGDSWDEKGFDPGLEALLRKSLSRFFADDLFVSSRLKLASVFDPASGRHRIRPEQLRLWLQELSEEIASHRAALAASSPL